MRSWYHPDDHLFEFGGAQLLSAAFPLCPPSFAHDLLPLVEEGSDNDINFVIAVLSRYRGEPATHDVFKAIVGRLTEDDQRLRKIELYLESTGVVAGQFGFAEAHRAKKGIVASWQDNGNPKVKAFAAQFMARLDRRIAFEQREAEQQIELRKRAYDAGDPEV